MIIMFTHIKTAANLNNLFHFSIYRLDFLPISFHVIIFFHYLCRQKPKTKETYGKIHLQTGKRRVCLL